MLVCLLLSGGLQEAPGSWLLLSCHLNGCFIFRPVFCPPPARCVVFPTGLPSTAGVRSGLDLCSSRTWHQLRGGSRASGKPGSALQKGSILLAGGPRRPQKPLAPACFLEGGVSSGTEDTQTQGIDISPPIKCTSYCISPPRLVEIPTIKLFPLLKFCVLYGVITLASLNILQFSPVGSTPIMGQHEQVYSFPRSRVSERAAGRKLLDVRYERTECLGIVQKPETAFCFQGNITRMLYTHFCYQPSIFFDCAISQMTFGSFIAFGSVRFLKIFLNSF